MPIGGSGTPRDVFTPEFSDSTGSTGYYNTPTYFEGFLAGIDKFDYKKINTTARVYPGYLGLNSSKNLTILKNYTKYFVRLRV
jgi:hypothetical protein